MARVAREDQLGSASLHGVAGSMPAGGVLGEISIVIRTAAVLVMTAGYSLAAVIAGYMTRSDDVSARIMAHWGKTLLRMARCEVTVEHRASLPEGGAVLVANHQSYLDITMLQVALGARARFVARREIGLVPLFGKSIRSAGTLLIDRRNPLGMVHWVRDSIRCVQRGKWLIVFPEGTRGESGVIRDFHLGAFLIAKKSGLPVFPVYVGGGENALPRGERVIRPARLTVKVLPPLEPGDMTIEEMAWAARERIVSAQDISSRGGQYTRNPHPLLPAVRGPTG